MIRLIGLNKIFLILLLGILLGCFLFYYFVVAVPEISNAKRELANNDYEIGELNQNLEEIRTGIANFKDREAEFKELFRHDLFNSQNRVDARNKLTEIRDASGVLSAQYSVQSAAVEPNKKMEEAGHQILSTPMVFELEAIEDSDIYKFLFLLNYGFPGQVNIDSVSITREEAVTIPLLKQIGIGQAEMRPLVKSKITASWKTIVPNTAIELIGGTE